MNKVLFGLALGCLLPVLSPTAWAGFQEGAAAYGKGDYQTAMSEWMPLAQAGNAEAENAVGALYDNGLGVVSDEAEAFRWYTMAANQNYPMAMRNLGTMYATGHGVPYSLPQAQLWLGRAASAGDQVAAKRLGALPPVATASAEPVATPLAPTSSAVGTMLPASPDSNGFGANAGPSNFLTQPSQPPASAAAGNGQTATATAAQPAATAAAPVAQTPAGQAPSANPAAAQTTTATATAPAAAEPAVAQPAKGVAFPAPAAPSAAADTAQPAAVAPTAVVQQVASVEPASTDSVSTASTTGTAATGTAADGWHAFDIGDYKTALAIWQPLAQQGDANLQVLVGSLYDYGQGVKQDKQQALQWYLMAAEKGLGRAQFAAGSLLVKSGKERNLVEGYKWLTIAGDTLRGQGGDIAANQAVSLRKQIAKEMSQDDISKAESLAQSFHAG
ncbi:MAG TPA: tetratricopeptide repeat protein [Dongiaceae bacterium]|nr:tetratricopeptide repeat protein [Dongiaceae bacterium]